MNVLKLNFESLSFGKKQNVYFILQVSSYASKKKTNNRRNFEFPAPLRPFRFWTYEVNRVYLSKPAFSWRNINPEFNLPRCEMDRFNKAVTTLRILRRLLELLEQRDSTFVIRKYPLEMYLELNTFIGIRRTYLSRWISNSCWNGIGGWEIVFKMECSFFFFLKLDQFWKFEQITWIIIFESNITISRFDWLRSTERFVNLFYVLSDNCFSNDHSS